LLFEINRTCPIFGAVEVPRPLALLAMLTEVAVWSWLNLGPCNSDWSEVTHDRSFGLELASTGWLVHSVRMLRVIQDIQDSLGVSDCPIDTAECALIYVIQL